MNDLSFFYYGMVCFSLTLFGLLLTVLEFRGMSRSKNLIEQTRYGTASRGSLPEDRQVKLVVLTERGAALRRELAEEFHRPPPPLLSLGVADLQALKRLLEKLGPAASEARSAQLRNRAAK